MFIFPERAEEIRDDLVNDRDIPTREELIFLIDIHRACLFYYDLNPPENYFCETCKVRWVKLWRDYQTCRFHLQCVDCSGKEEGKDVSRVDRFGKIDGCDQIGWKVPAVPTPEGDGYWGYTSVPLPGVYWWQQLPTRKGEDDD